MTIRCKSCNRTININNYSCPVCDTVNFSTDSEVQSAYNKYKSRNSVIKLITIPVVFIMLIGGITVAIYFGVTAYKNEEIARAKQRIGYDAANELCGNNFDIYAFKSDECPPEDAFFIAYQGAPENFIADSVAFCNLLSENMINYDFYSVTIKCGDNGFGYDFNSHCARTDMLFDYSELECINGINRLVVYTYNLTEEEIENAKGNTYAFDVAFSKK